MTQLFSITADNKGDGQDGKKMRIDLRTGKRQA